MLEKYTEKQRKRAERIESEAQKEGGQWGHFSQSVFLKGNTFGAGGVCGALSVVFLGQIARGEGAFDTFVESKDGREVVMALAIQQRNTPGWNHLYLKSFGLQSAYVRLNDKIDEICELVKIKGYYDIGMSDWHGSIPDSTSANEAAKHMSAHAVVVINAPPTFLFFDPNYGVGAFQSMDNLSNFLRKYWKHIYKDMTLGVTMLERYILKKG